MLPDLGANLPFYIALFVGFIAVGLLAWRFSWLRHVLSLAVWAGALTLLVVIVQQRGKFDPGFGRFIRLGADDGQQVVGSTVRVPVGADGHFWVRVKLNGVERRMLVDSGATVTALSTETAAAAGLKVGNSLVPMIVQTANGSVRAQTATVDALTVGTIVARDLPVVVSPAFGSMDVVGMNFLSRLKSWRVEEGTTLVLEPHHPQVSGR